MISTAQIKLNLPMEMKILAEKKAKKFGLTLSSYLRYLLLNEIKVEEYPVYEASDRTEKAVARAMKNKDKWVKVDNMKEFLNNL